MWISFNFNRLLYTSKFFKQRKQLIWNVKFHVYTAAVFSQMNKKLNLQYHGIFRIIWRHIKVSTRSFHGKSVCPVIWWATGEEKPSFRSDFPFKVSTKRFTQNYCFQESGWHLFPGSSPDYWTHGFPVKASRENFNVTLYYAEDTMVL